LELQREAAARGKKGALTTRIKKLQKEINEL